DQVVAYGHPIVDVLSTAAEVALYARLAQGRTTLEAVRHARAALRQPAQSIPAGAVDAALLEQERYAKEACPFAWAQIALYRRGPIRPLSLPLAPGQQAEAEAPQRTFLDAGTRRILAAGFIGRRAELHHIRRRIRRGDRVFVFQGLGGLG